jgi:two-component system sensor histidine kinase GlrK
VKGSGLGLAIAREYALAQGGRVEVRERADAARGADFRLWLPLASAAEAESALVAESDSRSRPVRIAGAK